MRMFLQTNGIQFEDNRNANNRPDFVLWLADKPFWLEVKEKRQPIKLSNWPTVDIPEQNLFLIDELTARRMFSYGHAGGIILRDNLNKLYVFINTLNLWTQPRLRVNRQVNPTHLKGKWMLDMRNNVRAKSLSIVMRSVYEYASKLEAIATSSWCYGRYVGEEVPIGGELRTKAMKDYDYERTR